MTAPRARRDGDRRPRHLAILIAVLSFGVTAPAQAQTIPALTELTTSAATANPGLAGRRTDLVRERATLHGQIDALNGRCAAVVVGSAAETSCNDDQARLASDLASHIAGSNAFNAAAQTALAASAPSPPIMDPDTARVINGIEALARRWGWSATKLARLDRDLRALDIGGPIPSQDDIRQAWRDILARGQDPELVREASQGGGLGFAGAGLQTTHADCAVFAIANATGRPYGFIAARATQIMNEGDWRDPAARAAPRAAIESRGLNGGEVVMLAEIFGRGEVTPSADFARTLQEGRPVMVNVVATNGDYRVGHEVVLTKTFQHDGQTWYVMLDSYQDGQARRFVSAKELSTMLKENGVAYRPNPRRTPGLLRDGSGE